MKAKFLFILLSVLFIIPTSAAILNKHKHKIRLTSFTLRNKATTRSPIEFDMDVQPTVAYKSSFCHLCRMQK
mgnify:CR=1 FL=1